MHEVEVVCRRNEARSPFLAAFLKVHLPDVKFSSSGVTPNQKSVNNQVASNIAAEWGFEYQVAKVKSTSSEITSLLHLPVDSLVQSELEKILTLEQIIKLNYEKISSHEFIPIDPVDCNQSEMKYELAKLLGFGVLQLRQINCSQFPRNIEAITPQNPSSVSSIYSDLLERRIPDNLIIVDSSLKESNRKLIQAQDGVLHAPLNPPVVGAIYSSIFEFPEPERLLCSLRWRDWLSKLTQIGKVVIVTPPLVDEQGSTIHDSHLAAIWAEGRSVI